jgi:hypothetical protein
MREISLVCLSHALTLRKQGLNLSVYFRIKPNQVAHSWRMVAHTHLVNTDHEHVVFKRGRHLRAAVPGTSCPPHDE